MSVERELSGRLKGVQNIDPFLLFLILKILVISELITKKNRKKYNKEYHLLEEENDKKWSRV